MSSYAEQYSQVKNLILVYCGDCMFLKIDVIFVADFFNAMIFSETPNITTYKVYMCAPAVFLT